MKFKNYTKLSLMACLLFIFAESAFSQTFGIRAGVNYANHKFSNITEEESDYLKPLLAYHFGVVGDFNLSGNLSLEASLLYSGLGSKFLLEEGEDFFDSKTSLNYLKLPVLLKYRFGSESFSFFVNAGPYIAYGLNGKVATKSKIFGIEFDETDKIDFKEDEINRLDYGILAGVGVGFGSFDVGLNYGLGLNTLYDIYDENGVKTDDTVKNSFFSLSLTYKF